MALDEKIFVDRDYLAVELAKKANSSHGTHVTWSTTTPKANGTASVGSEAKVARGDHVHPLQTTVSGNAGTATKLATARTIQIGNKSKSFDGSANITYSLADIGAAASSHTHNNIVNQDTRNVNTTPDGAPIGLSVHLKSNGKDGLSDGGTYHSSLFIKGWNDHSGGPYGNIAISTNNNLWYRASSSGTAWKSWKKVSVDGHTHNYAASSHTHTLFTRNSVGDIGWSSSNQGLPVAVSAIAYWNGAYSGTSSNLAYCKHGAFGSIVTKSSSDYASSSHTHTAVNGYTIWVGTQAQYDAISSKSSTTIYMIKD